jgi:hypothetical protein
MKGEGREGVLLYKDIRKTTTTKLRTQYARGAIKE